MSLKLIEKEPAIDLSDHSPVGIDLGVPLTKLKRPFQICSHVLNLSEFSDTVLKAWDCEDSGDPWFILTSKMKKTK